MNESCLIKYIIRNSYNYDDDDDDDDDSDGLESRPGGVKDSHPLSTTKTRNKRGLHGLPGSQRI